MTLAIASKAIRQVVKRYRTLRIFSIIKDSKRKNGPQSCLVACVVTFPSEIYFIYRRTVTTIAAINAMTERTNPVPVEGSIPP